MKIKTALISVSDKRNLKPLLNVLKKNKVKIISSGGTFNEIKKLIPNACIGADVIVGFPGETKDDFQATLYLVEHVKFDESFSFIQSPRPNTPAAEMEDNVSLEEKKDRLAILQDRLNHHAFNIGRKMVGTTERCLVTGISKKNPGELQARTENNRVVNFPSSAKLIGEFVDIEIVDQLTNCLRGKIKTETNLCQN